MSFKSNPYVATFTGTFAGVILTQLQAMYDSGNLDFTKKGIIHCLIGAAIGGALSVYHLFLPQPAENVNKPVNQENTTADQSAK